MSLLLLYTDEQETQNDDTINSPCKTSKTVSPSSFPPSPPLPFWGAAIRVSDGVGSQEELREWIAEGYDLYLIGFQECLLFKEFR